jgi:hypothetical protein
MMGEGEFSPSWTKCSGFHRYHKILIIQNSHPMPINLVFAITTKFKKWRIHEPRNCASAREQSTAAFELLGIDTVEGWLSLSAEQIHFYETWH